MIWITGKELLDPPYNLKLFDLIDLVKQGLQPYSPVTGDPIPCPPRCHESLFLWKELRAIRDLALRNKDDRATQIRARVREIRSTDPQKTSQRYLKF